MRWKKQNKKHSSLIRNFTCAPFSQESFTGPDLGASCLKRLSVDDTSSRWLRTEMGGWKRNNSFFSSNEGWYESAHAGILARTFFRAWMVFKGYQLSTLVHLIVDKNWALKKENYNVDFLLDERSLAIIPTAIQKKKKRKKASTRLDRSEP